MLPKRREKNCIAVYAVAGVLPPIFYDVPVSRVAGVASFSYVSHHASDFLCINGGHPVARCRKLSGEGKGDRTYRRPFFGTVGGVERSRHD